MLIAHFQPIKTIKYEKAFVLAGLCAALQTSAQYSQWTYNAGNPVRASNGHVIKTLGAGHIMAGPSLAGPIVPYVVRNDLAGSSSSSPSFNNQYMMASSTASLDVRECKVTEISNVGFALAGVCQDAATAQHSVFYQTLDQNGLPTISPITYYPGINTALVDISFGNIYASPHGNWLYIVGSVKNFDLDRWRPFLMKINYSGSIIWSHIYDDGNVPSVEWKAFDVAENASGIVAVVGSFDYITMNGHCFFVNSSNGGFALPMYLYGTNNSSDELYSITHSGTNDWLVCGVSNASGSDNAWIMRLDLSGNVNWSILDAPESGISRANQVVEYFNPNSGINEFYTVGTTENGPLGSSDVQVLKGDAGAGTLSDQFVYGGGNPDYGYGISVDNSSPTKGLAIFGSSESFPGGMPNSYFIKADFNGVSGCNEYLNSAVYTQGPGMITARDYYSTDYMMPFGNNNGGFQPGGENMICSSGLQVQAKDAGLSTRNKQMVLVSPNPVSAASEIQLNVTAPAGTIEVIVADYMGREYINQRFDIREGGEQTLAVALGKANLTPGLYLLKVNGLDKPATQVLVVK